MARKSHAFQPGEEITGARILRPIGPANDAQRFEIRWLCCGKLDEISRPALRARIRKGSRQCAACARADVFREIGKANRGRRFKRSRATPTGEGVMDLSGYWWPKLSELGPRWLQAGETNSRVGTGTEKR